MNRRRGQLPRLRVPRFIRSIGASLRRIRLPLGRRNNRRKGLLRAPRRAREQRAGARSGPSRTGLILAWFAPILLAGVAFSIPLFGVKAVEYIRESEHFHVKEIIIDGHRRLEVDALLELASIEAGMSVLEADLAALEAPLRAHPWVRWARVERRLPDIFFIRLIEREASAYLATGELWLIDETGEVFARAEPDEDAELPVISGVSPAELEATIADPSARVQLQLRLQAALNLSRTWALQRLSRRYPIGEIRLDPVRGHVVVAGGAGTSRPVEVVLGHEPYRDKLQRLEFTLEAMRARGQQPEYVLLDLSDETRRGGGPDHHLRGARVVVRADAELASQGDESAEDESPAHPFVGPPVPPSTRASRPNGSRRVNTRVDVETPATDPTPENTPEAAPLTGGRPADIFAGMED